METDRPMSTLQWLGEQHFEEQRSLRSSEENLFNWATSLFLAGLGALTSLKGLTQGSWSPEWRYLLMGAIIVLTCAVLFLAYLFQRSFERNQTAIAHIIAQLGQTGTPLDLPRSREANADYKLIFYVRWGAFGVIGCVMIMLIWMLG